MPEKFKEAFNVQMAVPAWSLVSALAIGIFAAGAIYQKLNALADSYDRTADKVTLISEKQVASNTEIGNMRAQSLNHEARITALERATWEKNR